MEDKQKILNDCRKILKCHLDKETTDWDLFIRQVHAMDGKYLKRGQEAYKYMQQCVKVVANALQMVEGELNG